MPPRFLRFVFSLGICATVKVLNSLSSLTRGSCLDLVGFPNIGVLHRFFPTNFLKYIS